MGLVWRYITFYKIRSIVIVFTLGAIIMIPLVSSLEEFKHQKNIIEAVAKRVKEETNTDAKINKFLGTYPIIRTNKNLLYIVFEAQVLSGIPKASAEIAEVITVDRESILNQKFGTTTSNVIHDWINSKTFESAVSK